MPQKRVLIVDDEEAILIVLKNSLKKLGSEYEVHTAPDGMTALQLIQHIEFDLLVTDYRMPGMHGLELISAARLRQPDIQVILMTAYGSSSLESELKPFQPVKYLSKPLEIDSFRGVVKDTFETGKGERSGLMVFSDTTYRQIHSLLSGLQNDAAARCIFLTNAEGNLVDQVGDTRDLPLEQIATLVGGGIAALFEAGRVLDQDSDTINFTFREGKHENLYAVNIGREWLLTVITENGLYSSKLGSVWYYTRQVAVAMQELLAKADQIEVNLFSGNKLEDALEVEFDELFNLNSIDHQTPALQTPHSSIQQSFPEAMLQPAAEPDQEEWALDPSSMEILDPAEKLLSFDEAVQAGLIQWPSMDGSIL